LASTPIPRRMGTTLDFAKAASNSDSRAFCIATCFDREDKFCKYKTQT
jgi:hypothetical protein